MKNDNNDLRNTTHKTKDHTKPGILLASLHNVRRTLFSLLVARPTMHLVKLIQNTGFNCLMYYCSVNVFTLSISFLFNIMIYWRSINYRL